MARVNRIAHGDDFYANPSAFLEIALSTRMREITIEDYDAYYQFVVSGARGEREWVLLVDRLAVQETSFLDMQVRML
jgi:chemotaxis methyl-accepting protein methylase